MIRVVVSLHGIRTRGVWQKDLAPILALNGFVPYALDYGWFSAPQLAWKSSRKAKLGWLRGEYERIIVEARIRRPSFIAHSFGALLVASLIEKYEIFLFDKIIFVGSIVRRDFEWTQKVEAGQVHLIRNEMGSLDPWPRVARKLIPGTGNSGTDGFMDPIVEQKEFKSHEHGTYFHRPHFKQFWIPTLQKVLVAAGDRRPFVEIMDLGAQAVSSLLEIDPRLVRANVFVRDENRQLSIPAGLHHHMDDSKELTLSIAEGTGCTGIAFKERKQVIAILIDDWKEHRLPEGELAKVNPRLRWIISTPIPDPDVAGGVLGVFNVDGLEVRKERDELQRALPDLARLAEALTIQFQRNNRGD